MTKDEAFKQLNGAEMVLLNRDFKSFNQAILMAMDALLDQKRLSNKVKTLAEELEEKGCRLAYYEDLEEQGRLVERERGEWKQRFEDWRQQIEGDECSVCGFQHYGTSIERYHFCPCCGADMRPEGGAE